MDGDRYPTPPSVDVANGDGSSVETCRDFLQSAVGRMNDQQEWLVDTMRDHKNAVQVKLEGLEAGFQTHVEQNKLSEDNMKAQLEDQAEQIKSLKDKLSEQSEQNKSLVRKNECLELEIKRMKGRIREQNVESQLIKLHQRLTQLETASAPGTSQRGREVGQNLNPAKSASVGRSADSWKFFRKPSAFHKSEADLLEDVPIEWGQVHVPTRSPDRRPRRRRLLSE